MARGCAFCSETDNLTGEHLWSAWIGRALGKRRYTFIRKEKDGSVRKWHRAELNEKAKVVCGHCNNGWMSDLETSTKVFLNDMVFHCSSTVLQPRQIVLLAAVAFKNTVVADHMHDNHPPFFSLRERRRFMRNLTIPSAIQMWLASASTQGGLFKCGYIASPVGASDGFEINHFTHGVGHVVVQVVASRWKKKSLRRHTPPPILTQAPEWNPVSIPFWPSDGKPINLPPIMHLGDEIIDKFVQRWTKLERGF
jgi:hypothetical protein